MRSNCFLFILFILLLHYAPAATAQGCQVLGQTPATAFPVCGTTEFKQETVPLCSSHSIIVKGCDAGAGYMDYNPFWYKFTCFKAGALVFTVTPNNMGDDYDWQLYDITGHNPGNVFTDPSLIVTGNWAGTFGRTGANYGGSKTTECASDPSVKENSFAAPPMLIKDHQYLLLISHFTQTQSGYSLSFTGGTASITDPTIPALKDIRANCAADEIVLRTSKRMKCSSLAQDGSDFFLSSTDVTIVGAQSANCSSGFDMDSITIMLDKPLPPGTYTLSMQEGGDGNTLLDNCDNALRSGDSLLLVIEGKQPTPFDSIAPVTCAPDVLELVFKKPMRCETIADDGSDFSISGSDAVSINKAYGFCTDGVSSSVFLQLSHPLVLQGSFTITTKIGVDGNTVFDECGEETPVGQSVSFSVKDTVSAAFTAKVGLGCVGDTIFVSHLGNNGVNNWQWFFSDSVQRSGINTQVIYGSYGEKNIMLVASNGFCTDTATTTVNLGNELKARFVMPGIACPSEPVMIKDTSVGNIISYHWNFGNGNLFNGKDPFPQIYRQLSSGFSYPVQLVVENDLHCFDTTVTPLNVVYSCHIAVPSAFTPNGDGINDYLYPLNAYRADGLLFTVYNRLGQVVFKTSDWTKKWNGTLNGAAQPAGAYVWTLMYTNHDTNGVVSQHGTAVLIR